jgi:hypothetical protein
LINIKNQGVLEGGPAQAEGFALALTMTRGNKEQKAGVMGEPSVLPLTPSVKPPLSKVDFQT